MEPGKYVCPLQQNSGRECGIDGFFMGAVMKHRKATGSGYTFSLSIVAVIFSSKVDIKTEPLCSKKGFRL